MTSRLNCGAGKADPVGPGLNLNFDADDDFLGDGAAKASNLPDFSDLDKQLQQEDCNAAVNQVKYPSAIDEHLLYEHVWTVLYIQCTDVYSTVVVCCCWILQDGYPAAATAPSVIVAEAPDANILKTRTYVSHSNLLNCWVCWDVHDVHSETKSESWVRTVLFFGLLTQAPVQKKHWRVSVCTSVQLNSCGEKVRCAKLVQHSSHIKHCASLCYQNTPILHHTPQRNRQSAWFFLKAAKLYLSCSLFVLAIWFIQEVTGGHCDLWDSLDVSMAQHGTMFCVLACFWCHWGLVHYLWQVLSNAKTLAVWL